MLFVEYLLFSYHTMNVLTGGYEEQIDPLRSFFIFLVYSVVMSNSYYHSSKIQ